LAEQAKILLAEGEENNLDDKDFNPRWKRWNSCSLCEQDHHGIVRCALGWACWKTYMGQPETDQVLLMAWSQLGRGLNEAKHHEDALSVREAELSTLRRLDAPGDILVVQGNIANSYQMLGQLEKSLSMRRDVYSGTLKLRGEEGDDTIREANNYAGCLVSCQRFEEAKVLLRKTMPVARRVLGESNHLTLRMRLNYAGAFYFDTGASLDDLREAVNTLEETERTARRVLGGAHPLTEAIEKSLRFSRSALRAREPLSS